MLVICDPGHSASLPAHATLSASVRSDVISIRIDEVRDDPYTVADKTLKVKVDHSTFANWNGAEQTRTIVITADEMKWTNPAGSAGGVAELVLKRAPKATN
jgi:hypothetical protein